MRLYIRARVCLAVVLVSAFWVASMLRSSGLFIHDIYRIQEFFGGDHVTHLLMGATFMAAGFLVVLPKSVASAVKVALAVLTLLALEEFSQIGMMTREFSWMDLLMSGVGAMLVMVGLVGTHLVSLRLGRHKLRSENCA